MFKKVFVVAAYISSIISTPVPRLETDPIPQPLFDQYVPFYEFVSIEQPLVAESVSLLAADRIEKQTPEFSTPVDWDLVDPKAWLKPHHDYPASDIIVPVGTPVFAIRGGSVNTATSDDGGACGGSVGLTTDVGQFLYCHLSRIVVRYNDQVVPGQLIGYSGGKPGARGAGSSSVPHVHIGFTRNGRTICPQPLIYSIANGLSPDLTVTTKCIN